MEINHRRKKKSFVNVLFFFFNKCMCSRFIAIQCCHLLYRLIPPPPPHTHTQTQHIRGERGWQLIMLIAIKAFPMRSYKSLWSQRWTDIDAKRLKARPQYSTKPSTQGKQTKQKLIKYININRITMKTFIYCRSKIVNNCHNLVFQGKNRLGRAVALQDKQGQWERNKQWWGGRCLGKNRPGHMLFV